MAALPHVLLLIAHRNEMTWEMIFHIFIPVRSISLTHSSKQILLFWTLHLTYIFWSTYCMNTVHAKKRYKKRNSIPMITSTSLLHVRSLLQQISQRYLPWCSSVKYWTYNKTNDLIIIFFLPKVLNIHKTCVLHKKHLTVSASSYIVFPLGGFFDWRSISVPLILWQGSANSTTLQKKRISHQQPLGLRLNQNPWPAIRRQRYQTWTKTFQSCIRRDWRQHGNLLTISWWNVKDVYLGPVTELECVSTIDSTDVKPGVFELNPTEHQVRGGAVRYLNDWQSMIDWQSIFLL